MCNRSRRQGRPGTGLCVAPPRRSRPAGPARSQIHIRYYLFAILFLIFDVEAVFLFPWAVTFLDVGKAAFYEMVIFIVVLGAGLAYAWKKGVLQWK